MGARKDLLYPRIRALKVPGRWVKDALCAQLDPEFMFSHERVGSGPDPQVVARQRSICRKCPIRVECLDWALANGEKYGMWGGHTTAERRRMRGQMMVQE